MPGARFFSCLYDTLSGDAQAQWWCLDHAGRCDGFVDGISGSLGGVQSRIVFWVCDELAMHGRLDAMLVLGGLI